MQVSKQTNNQTSNANKKQKILSLTMPDLNNLCNHIRSTAFIHDFPSSFRRNEYISALGDQPNLSTSSSSLSSYTSDTIIGKRTLDIEDASRDDQMFYDFFTEDDDITDDLATMIPHRSYTSNDTQMVDFKSNNHRIALQNKSDQTIECAAKTSRCCEMQKFLIEEQEYSVSNRLSCLKPCYKGMEDYSKVNITTDQLDFRSNGCVSPSIEVYPQPTQSEIQVQKSHQNLSYSGLPTMSSSFEETMLDDSSTHGEISDRIPQEYFQNEQFENIIDDEPNIVQIDQDSEEFNFFEVQQSQGAKPQMAWVSQIQQQQRLQMLMYQTLLMQQMQQIAQNQQIHGVQGNSMQLQSQSNLSATPCEGASSLEPDAYVSNTMQPRSDNEFNKMYGANPVYVSSNTNVAGGHGGHGLYQTAVDIKSYSFLPISNISCGNHSIPFVTPSSVPMIHSTENTDPVPVLPFLVASNSTHGCYTRGSKPAADKVNLPPLKSLSAFNFFFRDERDRILRYGETFNDTEVMKIVGGKIGSVSSSSLGGMVYRSKVDITVLNNDHEQKLLNEHWNQDRTKKRRHRKTHGKVSFMTLSRVISERWKNLGSSQKEFYKILACKDLQRYHRDVYNYKTKTKIMNN